MSNVVRCQTYLVKLLCPRACVRASSAGQTAGAPSGVCSLCVCVCLSGWPVVAVPGQSVLVRIVIFPDTPGEQPPGAAGHTAGWLGRGRAELPAQTGAARCRCDNQAGHPLVDMNPTRLSLSAPCPSVPSPPFSARGGRRRWAGSRRLGQILLETRAVRVKLTVGLAVLEECSASSAKPPRFLQARRVGRLV